VLAAAVAGLFAFALAALAPAASAATIEVKPGANAINKALAKAHNGDTLRIHDGTYRESFDIAKRVTLRGVGGRPLIDARCNSRATISTAHAGVTLDHLKVVGAADNPSGPFPSEVDFRGVATGTIHDVVIHDTCGGPEEGAEYGINVFNSGPVYVTGNRATGGFSDAGIYIGGIIDTGGEPLRVLNNETYLNNRGIIVEDSGGAGIVQVAHNRIHHNIGAGVGSRDGIFLHNSDRVRIRNNTVRLNGDSGVFLDANSDHNRLLDNIITGNPTDLINDGSANCGSDNTIGSKSGNPLVACP
jgi:parallel beta-helix repeat protein